MSGANAKPRSGGQPARREPPPPRNEQEALTIPGAWLDALACKVRLSGLEWRVIALVLARQPISARRVAGVLRVHYANAKRTARELVRWDILRPSPEGLRFQPDASRWDAAVTPPRPGEGKARPSKAPPRAPAHDPDDEVVFNGRDPDDEVAFRG